MIHTLCGDTHVQHIKSHNTEFSINIITWTILLWFNRQKYRTNNKIKVDFPFATHDHSTCNIYIYIYDILSVVCYNQSCHNANRKYQTNIQNIYIDIRRSANYIQFQDCYLSTMQYAYVKNTANIQPYSLDYNMHVYISHLRTWYSAAPCTRTENITHWGRVTHICVIICSHNGLSRGRHQAIIWTNAGILLIGPLGINFSEILIAIEIFSFTKMDLEMSSGKCRPFCLGLNVLSCHDVQSSFTVPTNCKWRQYWWLNARLQ